MSEMEASNKDAVENAEEAEAEENAEEMEEEMEEEAENEIEGYGEEESNQEMDDIFKNNHDLIGVEGILKAQKTEIEKKKIDLRMENERYIR